MAIRIQRRRIGLTRLSQSQVDPTIEQEGGREEDRYSRAHGDRAGGTGKRQLVVAYETQRPMRVAQYSPAEVYYMFLHAGHSPDLEEIVPGVVALHPQTQARPTSTPSRSGV